MRPFTIIAPTIWTGDTGREWKERGPYFQLLGHYLAESPQSNQYGLYHQPFVTLLDDVGVDRPTALGVLQFFSETNYAHYDPRSQWVFVVNMWERQFMASVARTVTRTDKRVLGMVRWYENCPSNPYLGLFYDRYAADFGLPRRRDANSRMRLGEAAGDSVPVLSDEQRALCDRWLAAYPAERRSGRQAVYAAWAKLGTASSGDVDLMITKLTAQKNTRKWTEDAGRYVPGAVRYLEERRFLDDVAPEATESDAEVAEAVRRLKEREG